MVREEEKRDAIHWKEKQTEKVVKLQTENERLKRKIAEYESNGMMKRRKDE